MKEARATAFQQVSIPRESGKNWTKANCDLFLAHNCVNKKIQDECYSKASKAFESNKVMKIGLSENNSTSRSDPVAKNILKNVFEEYQKNPSSMYLPKCPPIWELNNFDVCDFPVALGHQLFLGVGKQLVVYFSNRYFKMKGKLNSFSDTLDRLLTVVDSHRLDYLRIQRSSGSKDSRLTLTGWKCKDILSFYKIGKWLFSYSLSCVANETDKKIYLSMDVKKNIITLSPDEIESWLLRRGINTDGIPNRTKKNARKGWFMTKLDNPFGLFAHYTTREKLEFLEDRHPLQYEHILSLSGDKNDQMTFLRTL